jgi:hypothetical protein
MSSDFEMENCRERSVSKARVESLSHREYSHAEDAMDQEDKG